LKQEGMHEKYFFYLGGANKNVTNTQDIAPNNIFVIELLL
jgi:hypothetical protein